MKITVARLFTLAMLLPMITTCGTQSEDPGPSVSLPTIRFFVYTANGTDNNVSAFAMNQTTGALTSVSSNVAAGTNAVALAGVYPYLFAINRGSKNVTGYRVDAQTGALTPLTTGFPYSLGAVDPVSAVMTYFGHLYIVDQSGNKVKAYAVDYNTGELSIVGSYSTGSTPEAITTDQFQTDESNNEMHLYVTNNAGSVSAFKISDTTTGTLSAVAGSPFSAGTTPNGISTGLARIFVANTGGSNVSVYDITNPSGALSQVSNSPFSTVSFSYVIAADPFARFVYTQNNNSIEGYSVSGAGALSAIGGSPFSLASGPNGGMVIDYYGKFLYTHSADGKVYAFAVNQSTGALSALSTPSYTAGTTYGLLNSIVVYYTVQ